MESHFYKIFLNLDFEVLVVRGIRVSGSNFVESGLEIWVSESNFEIWKKFSVAEWNFWPKNQILDDGMLGFWQFDFEIWVRESISLFRSNLVSRPKNLNLAPFFAL